MAIVNIANKCERKRKAAADEKLISAMTIDEKLEAIKEYVVDQIDIHQMATEISKASRSTTAESASRSRTKVHFTD